VSILDANETGALVIAALDRFEIPHLVAGSHASSYYGKPRATSHIDLVIAPRTRQALVDLVESFQQERFHADAVSAEAAFRARSMFNVIDSQTGVKVDLIFLKDAPFHRSEFSRRVPGRIFGVAVSLSTPEDTVIAKLDWAKRGDSGRQLRDVVSILAVEERPLDRAYIAHWTRELGVAGLWERVQREAAAG
jgi:hypothetical protein